MLKSEETIKSIWSKLDEDKTIRLLMSLIEASSPTGYEDPAAELLAGFMEQHGVEVTLQEVEEGRHNVIGVVRGDGSGPRILFNGHLDTSFTGDFQEDYAMAGDLAHVMVPKATLEDGVVYGLGARNMKPGVTAMTAAICALAESGIKPAGDVTVAGVVGEIERSPVKGLLHSYDGKSYRGCGIGAKYLLDHGYTADFGITAEPSSNKVQRARVGFMFVKVTTTGVTAYSPSKAAGAGENAIVKMGKVVTAIEEEFGPRYAQAHAYDLGPEDGRMEPQVNVGGIDGGLPFKPNYVPAICCSYVDIFFTPKQTPKDAVDELRAFLSDLATRIGVTAEVEPYLTRGPATETSTDHHLVQTCKRIYEYTTGEKHPVPEPARVSIGDDSNTTRMWGIPSVTWGPGGLYRQEASGRGEYVTVGEVLNAPKMYTAAMVELIGRKAGGPG